MKGDLRMKKIEIVTLEEDVIRAEAEEALSNFGDDEEIFSLVDLCVLAETLNDKTGWTMDMVDDEAIITTELGGFKVILIEDEDQDSMTNDELIEVFMDIQTRTVSAAERFNMTVGE